MNNISKETIEQYLRNELSAGELSDFTFQMVMNLALRKEVEATRTLFKTLQTTAVPGSITSIPSSGGYKLTIGVIAGLLLLAIAAFFFFQNRDSVDNFIPPTELIQPYEMPANVPIAEAFIRNEFIENSMDMRDLETGKRVADFKVVANKKALDFSGNFIGEIQRAKMTIWNNQKVDFVEERFVFAKEMVILENGIVDFKVKNMLASGVYYFEIRMNGKLGKVGRFEVKE
ncbi:MAG: hypothetical protein ACI9XO_000095 [Paraglaciecola sp.]|jgi:hypothetical protein